ncbi:MAG: hypothetical protein AAGF28_06740 [Pseudomonadota bacterium]
MVQIFALAAVATVGVVAYTSFRKHWNALQEEDRIQEQEMKSVGELEQDPKTGKYRPKK